jgi:hypothetical protein
MHSPQGEDHGYLSPALVVLGVALLTVKTLNRKTRGDKRHEHLDPDGGVAAGSYGPELEWGSRPGTRFDP